LKVVISGDDGLRFRLQGAFENPVVRFICGDDVDGLLGVDKLGELLDHGQSLTDAFGGSFEGGNVHIGAATARISGLCGMPQ
jgi:hypothetical protein